MQTVKLNIHGMHCANCARTIAKGLEKEPGVKSTDVNFTSNSATIEFDDAKVDTPRLEQVVREAGYDIQPNGHDHHHGTPAATGDRALLIQVILASLLSLPLLIGMFWMWEVPGKTLGVMNTHWIHNILAFITVFILGRQFHANAFRALRKFRADMDALISIGTLAAYFYSTYSMFTGGDVYFEAAATITALILLGRYMETKARLRASDAMKKLLSLGAAKARIIFDDGREDMVPVDEVKTGQVFLAKPGEKIPLDGEILDGASNLDEAMLSGESLPRFKEKGDAVYAATIALDGSIRARVTKLNMESALAQIVKTVEEAQKYKAPAQKLADRISSVFVPVVIVISFLTLVGWLLATGDFGQGLLAAVAVLVISCPCALGIATPMAIFVGSSVGAKNGILIKNGESFEKAGRANVIIFDKTGTLTSGRPELKNISSFDLDFAESKVLKIAASLAKNSLHPLSKAVTSYAQNKGIQLAEMRTFREIPGQGLKAECAEHGTAILLGNKKLLQSEGVDLAGLEAYGLTFTGQNGNYLYVAHGGKLVGALYLLDQLKPSAKESIAGAKNLNIHPVIISGDMAASVKAVADELGVERFIAEALPQDKQSEIKKLQANGDKVIFAGDGINDAPALVQSDLGIAMSSGSDIAKESGDIIILNSDPQKIIDAVILSRRTFSVIKQNLFWAFFYNSLAIPLAIFGLVNPIVAALAMGLSDITVIGNSLRLYKSPKL